uniref:pyridoxamine 5'-phosphate oxidase family protein n=1 Tax=Cryptosporangium minutisporangium TaxID=113569 RepID=UPI00366C443D
MNLPEAERNEFLGNGGTGVLAFGTGPDESPTAFPVSYGYAAEAERFYFRLSFSSGTSKEDVIDNPVTLTVYDETDEGWRSVVASGPLEPLSDLPEESIEVQQMWAVTIPTIDIFDRPRDEIPFQDFCLDPKAITGRKSVPD